MFTAAPRPTPAPEPAPKPAAHRDRRLDERAAAGWHHAGAAGLGASIFSSGSCSELAGRGAGIVAQAELIARLNRGSGLDDDANLGGAMATGQKSSIDGGPRQPGFLSPRMPAGAHRMGARPLSRAARGCVSRRRPIIGGLGPGGVFEPREREGCRPRI